MYLPLSVDLDLSPKIVDKTLDLNSVLWERLEGAGAKLKGNDTLFPVQFGEEVWKITYQVRRGYTEAGSLDLGGFTLLDAIKAGDDHPFWKSVRLPGVPTLWGSAAVVAAENKILLGKKHNSALGYTHVFGGTFTPPAGIVGLDDFELGGTLKDVLIRAAIRELLEETNIEATTDQVNGIQTYLEPNRCKQQAFVSIKMDNIPDTTKGLDPEFEYLQFFEFSSEGWQALKVLWEQINLS